MTDFLALLVPALGRALLHFLWQGALIGLLAAIALHLLRDARPQARYAVACSALLLCALVPGAYVIAQLWTPASADAAAATADVVRITGVAIVTSSIAADASSRLDAALPTIVLLWAAGAGALSLRMAAGWLWIQRLRATPQSSAHRQWQTRLDALAQRFGLRRAVALRIVESLSSPVSAGWWRPVVLVPAGLLTRMPADLIEALLAHELAHVRRHDYLVNLLQNLAEALLFYHPVTWWLSRRIRDEREHIADRLAADITGQPRRLALALSELAEWSCSHAAAPFTPALAQAAHGGHLMSRIEQLVRPGARPVRGGVALPLVGVAIACLAFYAHAQIGQDGKPTAATAAQATADAASRAKPIAQSQPAPKAAPAKTQVRTMRLTRDDRDAYALVSKDRDGIRMSGSTDDLPEIESARRSLTNQDFVWFRRGGKAYVVSDAETMAKVRDAWRDSDRIGAQMKTLGDQMEVHGDRMEALGAQMEKLSEQADDDAAMNAASRRMERLADQQSALAERQAEIASQMASADGAGRDRLEATMDDLGRQMDELGKQMDAQSRVIEQRSAALAANQAPMEALSRQMDEAGKPMDALGRQMDALGKQQEKIIDEAERKTHALLDSAIARGLARPMPLSAQ
ncbi:M56 family metallopeptidase [Lysobacter auxotrophicus]|uniref:M56 family metallopeptidase n=1 Tax=Lysobacter auxotrophicus TaxID=2992573 RepID=A0ABM8DDY3_9GAMM|nr:M56 family metallopeptidase [Lysobacter auxotrophicus]BDU16809.1 M56 family metallopeptidase [Lysobacter auxotrophicus]